MEQQSNRTDSLTTGTAGNTTKPVAQHHKATQQRMTTEKDEPVQPVQHNNKQR
jgi:hypothetical protein